MTGIKKRLGHILTHREDDMKTQGEDHHLYAKERGLRRNQTCQHCRLRPVASRTPRKQMSVVQAAQAVALGGSSSSK